MFPYFGKKLRSAKLYPAPRYDLIIEPFAGSLAYSNFHKPKQAIGVELDKRVVDLWNRMARLDVQHPAPLIGSKTNDLLVKLCSYSEHALLSETMTVTSRMVRDWKAIQENAIRLSDWALSSVDYRNGNYVDAPDIEATWFIDPPYQFANRRGYRFGASLSNEPRPKGRGFALLPRQRAHRGSLHSPGSPVRVGGCCEPHLDQPELHAHNRYI